MCCVAAGYLTMNETETRSLCIPFPVGGWDSQGADNNDTADDIVTPSQTASIMRAAMQPGTAQLGASNTAKMNMAMPLSIALSLRTGNCTTCILQRSQLVTRHMLSF